jgi:hypothetical protein
MPQEAGHNSGPSVIVSAHCSATMTKSTQKSFARAFGSGPVKLPRSISPAVPSARIAACIRVTAIFLMMGSAEVTRCISGGYEEGIEL